MTIRWLGQELGPSELLRQLPSCYSAEFDKCVGDFDAGVATQNLSEYCRQFQPLYAATRTTIWDAAMESMPFCAAPTEKKAAGVLPFAAAGAVGLLVGMLVR